MRAAVIFLAGLVALSCGAARVTAYTAVDEACEHAEQEIEDRTGSTLAEDERDLRTVRDACDRILEAVETSGGEES